MFKTILVHLNGTERDISVLQTALNAAKPFDAHIDCYHITPDYKTAAYLWAEPEASSGVLIAEALEALETEAKERLHRARKYFSDFCAENDIVLTNQPPGPDLTSAALHQETGELVETLIAQSRYHDLVVVAGGTQDGEGFTKEGLGNLIVSAGRPVLLAPQTPPKAHYRTIAVAWKNSPEAARAISAAMPLLSKAHNVVILSANENDGKALNCIECYESVANQLRWHGLNVEGHYVVPEGRTIPKAVIETAKHAGADVLVMGGYSHSRMRELVFGGFTRAICNGVDLPVFIFH